MAQNQNLIEDIVALGSSLFSNALDARHEIKAQVKQRLEVFARQLDLVTREEFDAAFTMLAKTRDMQEKINVRLSAIEDKLNLSRTVRAIKDRNKNLPSVKEGKRRTKRK